MLRYSCDFTMISNFTKRNYCHIFHVGCIHKCSNALNCLCVNAQMHFNQFLTVTFHAPTYATQTYRQREIETDRANFVLHLQLLDHQQNYVSILTNDPEHIISKHSSTFVYTSHIAHARRYICNFTQTQPAVHGQTFWERAKWLNDSTGIEMVAKARKRWAKKRGND